MNNKSHSFILLAVLLVFVLSITSCKKALFDQRNKYLGDWQFKVYRSEYHFDSIAHYKLDTLYFSGKIVHASNPEEITIYYTQFNSITLKVYDYGNLDNFPTVYCSGKFFDTKNLNIYLRWGGLGGGTSHSISGRKKL